MQDETARTADRVEAAKWLTDRGFGRSVQALSVDVAPQPHIDVTMLSDEHLEALLAILKEYRSDAADIAAAGRIEIGSSAVPPDRS